MVLSALLKSNWFGVEVVKFKGHQNIQATHPTTFEITKENYLTKRGDCIVGVSADKSLSDFSSVFKKLVRKDGSTLVIVIAVKGVGHDIVIAKGSQNLSYSDETRIIVRKSAYTSPNTAGIHATKAAADLDRTLIHGLKEGKEGVAVFIIYR